MPWSGEVEHSSIPAPLQHLNQAEFAVVSIHWFLGNHSDWLVEFWEFLGNWVIFVGETMISSVPWFTCPLCSFKYALLDLQSAFLEWSHLQPWGILRGDAAVFPDPIVSHNHLTNSIIFQRGRYTTNQIQLWPWFSLWKNSHSSVSTCLTPWSDPAPALPIITVVELLGNAALECWSGKTLEAVFWTVFEDVVNTFSGGALILRFFGGGSGCCCPVRLQVLLEPGFEGAEPWFRSDFREETCSAYRYLTDFDRRKLAILWTIMDSYQQKLDYSKGN